MAVAEYMDIAGLCRVDATVNPPVFLNNSGVFASITDVGVGIYRLNRDTDIGVGWPAASVIVKVTSEGGVAGAAFSVATYVLVSEDIIEVRLFDAAGYAEDGRFSFEVRQIQR